MWEQQDWRSERYAGNGASRFTIAAPGARLLISVGPAVIVGIDGDVFEPKNVALVATCGVDVIVGASVEVTAALEILVV